MKRRILFIPAELITPVDQLSDNTRRRCETGFLLWRKAQFDHLLLSGGIFSPPAIQTQSASSLMKRWFRGFRVPEEHILLEENSKDTYENVHFSMELLTKRQFQDADIVVCTQLQHGVRVWLTFLLGHRKWVKLHVVRQPEMNWKSWIVEWFFLIPYHVVDWKGTGPVAKWNRERRSHD